MRWSSWLLFLFLFYSTMVLVALVAGDGLPSATYNICKSFIIPTLFGYYWASTKARSSFIMAALVFCWLGDVLLLGEGELYFMGGLVAFLIGHVFYIVAYRQHRLDDSKNELMTTQKMRYSFPVVLAATGLLVILFPKLGGLKIPVTVYALVLMIMVMTAIFRYGRTAPKSFWMVLSGAAFFMLSDSLLAINKFYMPLPWSGIWVMSTYIAAQYLIVSGILKHSD